MKRIEKIVVVGGGTAGWMTASSVARTLGPLGVKTVLIESADIGTVGVGEATIPPIIGLLKLLGIPETTFIKETNATFKLAIRFDDWLTVGKNFWHPFGSVGGDINDTEFYQHWIKSVKNGNTADFTDYSPSAALADANKFHMVRPDEKSHLVGAAYAYHFDASLVAKMLREYSEAHGVERIEATVKDVQLTDDGSIKSLSLDNGDEVDGDIFFDCSGMRGLLIEGALKTGFEDWTHYLPCDSAVVVQTSNVGQAPPYTVSIAMDSGWRWRIPLQNRTGNGYVFSSAYTDDETAEKDFRKSLKGDLIGDPRFLRFKTGMRKKAWNKNCIAIGLSSGFLEPLESTSIHLAMKAVFKFLEMVPNIPCAEATINEYNRAIIQEYESARDFIILHYCTTRRDDTKFWRDCAAMSIPQSLQDRLDLFKSQGRLMKERYALFPRNSWYSVFEGMGIRPTDYDPLADLSNSQKVEKVMSRALRALNSAVEEAPDHEEFISKFLETKH